MYSISYKDLENISQHVDLLCTDVDVYWSGRSRLTALALTAFTWFLYLYYYAYTVSSVNTYKCYYIRKEMGNSVHLFLTLTHFNLFLRNSCYNGGVVVCRPLPHTYEGRCTLFPQGAWMWILGKGANVCCGILSKHTPPVCWLKKRTDTHLWKHYLLSYTCVGNNHVKLVSNTPTMPANTN